MFVFRSNMKTTDSMQVFSIILMLFVTTMDARPKKETRDTEKTPSLKSIILFPKARSWCRAQDIGHMIDHEGCESTKIQNKFCIGQCFSYVSPDIMPRKSELRLSYCDSCQPTKTTWQKVQLKCGEGKTVEKLVELVLECKCKDCRRNHYGR